MQGDEGGKGIISSLAASVASLSTPANTVKSSEGKLGLFNDSITPGLAFAAAHPQTEFIISTADLLCDTKFFTSSAEVKSLKPTDVSSFFIGSVISFGYIIFEIESKYNKIDKKFVIGIAFVNS